MRLAAVFFASFLAFAAASGYQRLQSGGYYAWKSKCVGFELVKGVSGSVVTSGQINFQQIYSSDMYANSSQWNVKQGDPAMIGPFETRNQVLDVGNMYPCAGVDPSLYCPTSTVGVSNCVVCTKHLAFGWFQTGSWLRPDGQAAWLIDSLPFPHVPLSYTNQSVGVSFSTTPSVLEVKYDAFGNDPAASVPQNVSIWVEEAKEVPGGATVTARQLYEGPDYVLVFSPVLNGACAWRPF